MTAPLEGKEPPAREGWHFGSTIDRASMSIRYFSVSSLELGRSCARRYVFQYVFGLREPPTEHTDRGTRCHSEGEEYLLTGSKAHLSQQTLSGIHIMPEPGPDLHVEWELVWRPEHHPKITPENANALRLDAPVKIAGVPLLGKIDVWHSRGTNRGGTDVESAFDPPGTVEVADHKFPNKPKGKKAHELLGTTQMPGYGEYVFAVLPKTPLVRLSHHIIPATGRAFKSTLLADREAVAKAWRPVEAIAADLQEYVRYPDVNKVPGNEEHCFAYGRPCPAKHRCSIGQNIGRNGSDLSDFIDQDILDAVNSPDPLVHIRSRKAETLEKANMGISEKLAAARAKSGNPAPAPAVASEMLRLAAEEAAIKFPTLLADLTDIESLGHGRPTLAGALARAYADLKGYVLHGGAYAGSGEYAEFTLESAADVEEFLTAVAPGVEPTPEVIDVPYTSTPVVVAEPPPPKAKRAKREVAPPPVKETTTIVKETAGEISRQETKITREFAPTNSGKINVYVDCLPTTPTVSLWPIVRKILDALAAEVGVEDVRLCDQNSKYGFGRWKAGLSIVMSKITLEEGDYALDGSFGDIAQEIIGVMRERAVKSGGVFVRGVR